MCQGNNELINVVDHRFGEIFLVWFGWFLSEKEGGRAVNSLFL